MARIKVLLRNPSRATVLAIRDQLTKQGFTPPRFGDIRQHTRGQMIDEDVLVIGESAGRVKPDCHGRCIELASVDELDRIKPDRQGRPSLSKAADKGDGEAEHQQPEHDEPAAAAREDDTAPEPTAADDEPDQDEQSDETDGRERRRELFARARQAEAQISVSMTNDELESAIAKAERRAARR